MTLCRLKMWPGFLNFNQEITRNSRKGSSPVFSKCDSGFPKEWLGFPKIWLGSPKIMISFIMKRYKEGRWPCFFENMTQFPENVTCPQNRREFCFVFFVGMNVARIPQKNYVILMGLPTFYLDSWNYWKKR